MKRSKVRAVPLALAVMLVVAACGGSSDTGGAEDPTTTATPETTTAPESTTAPETTAAPGAEFDQEAFCNSLAEFEMALDAIDGDTIEEYETTFNEAKEEFAAVRAAAGDNYTAELDAMQSALDDFERELETAESELDLLGAVADIALAGEELDEKVECPGV